MNLINKIGTILYCFGVIGCSGGMSDGCCGWSETEVTGAGQIKQVSKRSPSLFCPDYYMIDVSLGIMRNGSGSVSKEDINIFIEEKDVAELRSAAANSSIIEFTYNTRRFSNCVVNKRMTSFKVKEAR